eukprot:1196297-Prorocentrum_minimum.AAC.9
MIGLLVRFLQASHTTRLCEVLAASSWRAGIHMTAYLIHLWFVVAIVKQVLELDCMSTSRHWQICGCSAVTGEGLLDGFDWVVGDIASRIYMFD